MPHWSITERVEQLAHRLQLQAGLTPPPLTGPYGHLAPKAAQGRQGALVAAHGRQAPAHGAEAGGGDGPGTGAQARRGHRVVLLACWRRRIRVSAPFVYTVTASSWPPSHSAQERVLR